MKKYYVIFGATGAAFVFGIIGLILNPQYQFKYLRSTSTLTPPAPTFIGDLFLAIALGLLVLACAFGLILWIYKRIRTIYRKFHTKENLINKK